MDNRKEIRFTQKLVRFLTQLEEELFSEDISNEEDLEEYYDQR